MTTPADLQAQACEPILVVEGLQVAYPNREGQMVTVVRDVSFTLGR